MKAVLPLSNNESGKRNFHTHSAVNVIDNFKCLKAFWLTSLESLQSNRLYKLPVCKYHKRTIILPYFSQRKHHQEFFSHPTVATTAGKLNSNTFAWQINSVFRVLNRRWFGFGGRWSTTRTTFLPSSLHGVLNLTRQKQLEFNPIFYSWDTFCFIFKGLIGIYTNGILKGNKRLSNGYNCKVTWFL